MKDQSNLLVNLNYISPFCTRPAYFDLGNKGKNLELVNYQSHQVLIRDARQKANLPILKEEGFELVSLRSKLEKFDDDEQIESIYYPEISNLLENKLNTKKVIVFDHTYREDSPDLKRQPVRHVHNDYTPYSAVERVVELLGHSDAIEALSSRYIQINTWRAIENPVYKSALTLAQSNSVQLDDLVETDLFYPDRHGEIYECKYNPGHKWWYYPLMTPDELLLFKGFDSDLKSQARLVPHTAFDVPNIKDDLPSRKSIETRAMIFF